MARLETWYKQDLKRPLFVHKHTDVFNQDSKGNLIGVEVYSDGEPVVLSGSISGYCLLADGTTVPAVGANRSGNKASVLIPQTAYSVPGPITITIKNVEGNDIATLCAVVGLVRQSVSGNLVNPGSVVTDWSNDINAQLQAVQTAVDNVGAIVAAPFDENTVYVVGNYVTNNGNLYRITSDHASGVAWANTAKVQCTVGHELEALNNHFVANRNLIDPEAASNEETDFIPVELNVRYNIIHAQSKGQFQYGLSLYDSNKTMLYIGQVVDEATDGTNYFYSCTFSESAIAYVKIEIDSAPSGIDTTDFSKVFFGKGSEYIEFDDYNVIDVIKKAKDNTSDITNLKSAINDITKEEIIGTGYGINIKENGIGTANISGNVLQNAYIRKCGKNLFNKEDCDSTTDFVANSIKSYQPFVPIYLVPRKTYKVTLTVKDRSAYNATTWSNKQWISSDPNTIFGINSSEFASVDSKTFSFNIGASGCLYFVNVWGEQAMLDNFFACFNVVIVETGIYDDETTYVEYNGTDVPFSETVDILGYENVIIHRDKNDADLQNALPDADISWAFKIANADADIEKAEKNANMYAESICAKFKLIPLFIDPITDFNWVSTYEISAFSSNNPAYADGTTDGNNGYFAISGNSGENYVTVIPGGNADISVLTNAERERWLGGVIIDDDGNVTPCNFFYKSSTEFYIYPTLSKNIENGQLAGIQTGIHLSKRGYKGYAQSLWNINPKHCEKSKYIKKYRPGDEIPFVVYGGKVGASTDTRNLPVQYQNKYGVTTYVLNMDWGSAQFHNTETGIEWTLDIGGRNGYVEAYVGDSGKGVTTSTIDSAGASYSFEYAEGAEIHCDLYVDGSLVDSYIKKSKKLERVCLDYGNGQTATLKVYSNKWQETGYGFSVGAITWWVNERWTDSAENPYLFKAITQLFDSWGDFQNQEVQRELENLHKNAIGTPVPINNKSMRNMTSQWGRLWFYENVQQENAAIMLSDFGINDYNSSITTFPDEVAPDGSAWPVGFTISSYADSICKLNEMAVKNNIQPITIGLGYRNAGAIIWMQSAIDAQSTKVT